MRLLQMGCRKELAIANGAMSYRCLDWQAAVAA
jgi:LSD1 subclass zinc finger protein